MLKKTVFMLLSLVAIANAQENIVKMKNVALELNSNNYPKYFYADDKKEDFSIYTFTNGMVTKYEFPNSYKEKKVIGLKFASNYSNISYFEYYLSENNFDLQNAKPFCWSITDENTQSSVGYCDLDLDNTFEYKISK